MTTPIGVRVTGPLAAYACGFWAELLTKQYTPLSATNQLRLVAHVSRWLCREGLGPESLSSQQVERFVRARNREGYRCFTSKRALRPLMEYLRRIRVVTAAEPEKGERPIDKFLAEYVGYLRQERGLAAGTVCHRRVVARDILHAIAGPELALDRLTADRVTGCVLAAVRGRSIGYAGLLATAVRSLLRFLHQRGDIAASLTRAVPKMAGWRLTTLPRALEPAQVEKLLRSCDRRTSVGRRDYAILLLLVRLGLRAGEVGRLGLDDIHWRRGEITIRGKGGRLDQLPLPADVGDALVAYIRNGRPQCAQRTVFVTDRAPRQPLSPSTVTACVRQAAIRAVLPTIHAHRLRHTAATQMLQRGSSLDDIAQVLRHSSVATTAIYAKVDRDALRTLAPRWPGGAR
jgi:integrase/recombinase XerD